MSANRVRIGGCDIAVRERGPRQGAAVLFLHPFPFASSCWEGMLERCADAGFRALAFDAPGFGDSPARGAPLEMDALADLAAGVLAASGVEHAAVVGCSMGGYGALAFARRHPQRLRALALVCTRAGTDGPEAREWREGQAQAALLHGAGAVTGPMVQRQLCPGSAGPVLESARALAAQATAQGIADALRGMAMRPDARCELGSIRVPTVVLAGEEDQLVPRADAEELSRGISGARLHVVGRSGHLPFLEQPEAVAAHLLALLRGLQG